MKRSRTFLARKLVSEGGLPRMPKNKREAWEFIETARRVKDTRFSGGIIEERCMELLDE